MSENSDNLPTNEIVERLLSAENLPETIHGIQRKTQKYGGGCKEIRLEIWEQPPIKARSKVLSSETMGESDFNLEVLPAQATKSDNRGEGGSVTVKNKHGLIAYDAESNQYHKREYEPSAETGGYTTRPTLIGSSPEANFDVTYDKTDTVAGRETHVLTFQPTDDADSFTQRLNYVTMWIDGTYWFPLKQEASHQLRNEGILQTDADEDFRDETYVLTKVFEEIEFDVDIEDSKFQFEPPEDAERVE